MSFYRRHGKRWLDLLLTVPTLLLLAPALGLLALLVRMCLGPPVLFRHRRPGLGGEPFVLFKLRTMTDERGPDGTLLPDARRLTPLGRALRRSSLDELPELFNVLRGEMSLVGPRPLLLQYLDRYTPEQARRHEVPPGITGRAVVAGRNAITWEEKLALDVWYVEHLSFGLDLRILLQTAALVVSGRGVQAPGHATMPELAPPEGRAEAPDKTPQS